MGIFSFFVGSRERGAPTQPQPPETNETKTATVSPEQRTALLKLGQATTDGMSAKIRKLFRKSNLPPSAWGACLQSIESDPIASVKETLRGGALKIIRATLRSYDFEYTRAQQMEQYKQKINALAAEVKGDPTISKPNKQAALKDLAERLKYGIPDKMVIKLDDLGEEEGSFEALGKIRGFLKESDTPAEKWRDAIAYGTTINLDWSTHQRLERYLQQIIGINKNTADQIKNATLANPDLQEILTRLTPERELLDIKIEKLPAGLPPGDQTLWSELLAENTKANMDKYLQFHQPIISNEMAELLHYYTQNVRLLNYQEIPLFGQTLNTWQKNKVILEALSRFAAAQTMASEHSRSTMVDMELDGTVPKPQMITVQPFMSSDLTHQAVHPIEAVHRAERASDLKMLLALEHLVRQHGDNTAAAMQEIMEKLNTGELIIPPTVQTFLNTCSPQNPALAKIYYTIVRSLNQHKENKKERDATANVTFDRTVPKSPPEDEETLEAMDLPQILAAITGDSPKNFDQAMTDAVLLAASDPTQAKEMWKQIIRAIGEIAITDPAELKRRTQKFRQAIGMDDDELIALSQEIYAEMLDEPTPAPVAAPEATPAVPSPTAGAEEPSAHSAAKPATPPDAGTETDGLFDDSEREAQIDLYRTIFLNEAATRDLIRKRELTFDNLDLVRAALFNDTQALTPKQALFAIRALIDEAASGQQIDTAVLLADGLCPTTDLESNIHDHNYFFLLKSTHKHNLIGVPDGITISEAEAWAKKIKKPEYQTRVRKILHPETAPAPRAVTPPPDVATAPPPENDKFLRLQRLQRVFRKETGALEAAQSNGDLDAADDVIIVAASSAHLNVFDSANALLEVAKLVKKPALAQRLRKLVNQLPGEKTEIQDALEIDHLERIIAATPNNAGVILAALNNISEPRRTATMERLNIEQEELKIKLVAHLLAAMKTKDPGLFEETLQTITDAGANAQTALVALFRKHNPSLAFTAYVTCPYLGPIAKTRCAPIVAALREYRRIPPTGSTKFRIDVTKPGIKALGSHSTVPHTATPDEIDEIADRRAAQRVQKMVEQFEGLPSSGMVTALPESSLAQAAKKAADEAGGLSALAATPEITAYDEADDYDYDATALPPPQLKLSDHSTFADERVQKKEDDAIVGSKTLANKLLLDLNNRSMQNRLKIRDISDLARSAEAKLKFQAFVDTLPKAVETAPIDEADVLAKLDEHDTQPNKNLPAEVVTFLAKRDTASADALVAYVASIDDGTIRDAVIRQCLPLVASIDTRLTNNLFTLIVDEKMLPEMDKIRFEGIKQIRRQQLDASAHVRQQNLELIKLFNSYIFRDTKDPTEAEKLLQALQTLPDPLQRRYVAENVILKLIRVGGQEWINLALELLPFARQSKQAEWIRIINKSKPVASNNTTKKPRATPTS